MAGFNLFVNTAATNVASALVRSLTDMTPIPFPELVIGDKRNFNLYFVDGQGNYESFSGAALYTPLIAIGNCGFATGGTFTLTFSGQTTSALAYNVSPAAMQTALQALSSIGSGNCTVSGVAGQYYEVTFTGTLGGAAQPEITGSGTNLTPESNVSVDTIVEGGVGVNEVQLIRLPVNPITYADDWTPISNGWTGTLSARTVEAVAALAAAGSITDTFQITVQDPAGDRRTYLKVNATIRCSIIDPESFAGADKPTFATVAYVNSLALAGGVFTNQNVTSSVAGNSNITRPLNSHHHTAFVTISGSANTRTFSIQTTNTPAVGDIVHLFFATPTTEDIVLEIYNSSTAGMLLKTITTDDSGVDYFLVFEYDGSAWRLVGDNDAMRAAQNLAGLFNIATSRSNLGTMFSKVSDKSADFTVTEAEDGTLYRVTAAGNEIVATLPTPSSVDVGWSIALLLADTTGSITTSPATENVTDQNQLMVLVSDGTTYIVLLRVSRPLSQGGPAVINASSINSLEGGSDSLNFVVTATDTYSIGTIFCISFGNAGQWWKLVVGTDADDPTNGVVRPLDFNASTNAKVWKRIA